MLLNNLIFIDIQYYRFVKMLHSTKHKINVPDLHSLVSEPSICYRTRPISRCFLKIHLLEYNTSYLLI
jgi:hypothetical protein